ncbi:MAG: T9SS type A sorting domain-containing protein [Bacteroidota bacterium]
MHGSLRCTLTLALALLLAPGVLAQAVVYDNSVTEVGTTSFSAIGNEFANTVALGGTERQVTSVSVALNRQLTSNSGTLDLQVRLYDVAASGEPGTLLYQGPVLEDVPLPSGSETVFFVDFDIPGVTVPDDAAWSVTILERNTDFAVGYRKFEPPVVGTFLGNFFRPQGLGGWASTTNSVGSVITAETGPASFTATVSPDTLGAGGGAVTFTGTLGNLSGAPLPVDIWLDASGPAGAELLLASATLPAGASVTRSLAVGAPGGLPAGTYDVNLNVGDFSTRTAIAARSFEIVKEGTVAGAPAAFTVPAWDDAFATAPASRAAEAALAAYPNPFAASTTFQFDLAEAGPARLAVYDMLGREVAVLADGLHAAGRHEASFDARGLAAGPYVWRLTAGATVQTGHVTLVR